MRTTVEIPDRLRAALLAISAKRGLRGFSKIIEEALDYYLQALVTKDQELSELLKLKGSWSNKEAEEMRNAVQDVRKNWAPRS